MSSRQPDTASPPRVLLVATELAPVAKVGGLADVAAALPKALAARGNDVTVLVPSYPHLPVGRTFEAQGEEFAVVELDVPFPVLALVDDAAFGRDEIYEYGDDVAQRFARLAAGAAALAIARRPHAFDVVHLNDWHPSTAAVRLAFARRRGRWSGGTLLTLHNAFWQGGEHVRRTPLQRAVRHADAVTTVSSGYRGELLSGVHGSGRLAAELRRREGSFFAVPNGLDYDVFDPATDRALAATYDVETLPRRPQNKVALQRAVGLDVDPAVPLVGFVGRLSPQKGSDVLVAAAKRLRSERIQLVAVGVGDEEHERELRRYADVARGSFAYVPDPREPAARRLYAGADVVAVPSRFEPFGLVAPIALRYGAVPVVSATGGLRDTVVDARTDARGTGFVVPAPPEAAAWAEAIAGAAAALRQEGWKAIQRRGMAARFLWDDAAAAYERLYAAVAEEAAGSTAAAAVEAGGTGWSA